MSLGVTPLLGRTFSVANERAGQDHVAILSYRLWESRFGGDRNVVGQRAILDGVPHTVIGVMPQNVDYPRGTELWTPLVMRRESVNNREQRFLHILARFVPV